MELHEVVIVGAGQAGLSVSHELTAAGVEHIVLERGQVGQSWRRRWDSFCLVLPNWAIQLPGGRYAGDDPDGFLPRDEFVAYLSRYAAGFQAPVRDGVEVTRVDRARGGGFLLTTSTGPLRADQLVLASGGYQRPHRPAAWTMLPDSPLTIDADDYTNPQALPPGGVLVVGSGQTGCQIAEELAEAGRRVHLACGRAPWLPRRLEGRDIISWLCETPYFDTKAVDLHDPHMRLLANVQCSGGKGGHDLNYRTLRAKGVTLTGHFRGARDGRALFSEDLDACVEFGDTRYRDLRDLLTRTLTKLGRRVPEMPDPAPFDAAAPTELDLAGVGAVVFTSGFRPDFVSWVGFPEGFDGMGFPIQLDGSSTVVPGLHFIGVHWQRTRKSATFLGVGEDAALVARSIVDALRDRRQVSAHVGPVTPPAA